MDAKDMVNQVPGWVTVDECCNCHGREFEYLTTVTTAPYLQVEFSNGFIPMLTQAHYFKCKGCGLVVQSPRMSDERIEHYYSSGLYRQTLGLATEYMDEDEFARAYDVAGWLGGKDASNPRRHLDIGCSRGYLLMGLGAEVQHGFDSNEKWLHADAKNVQVFSDKNKLETYDLVTAIHVLEHVIDPMQEIAWYKSLTTDYLLIEVPGWNCKGGPLRFAHLFYFPPETLMNILIAQDFEIEAVETEPNTRILCRKN